MPAAQFMTKSLFFELLFGFTRLPLILLNPAMARPEKVYGEPAWKPMFVCRSQPRQTRIQFCQACKLRLDSGDRPEAVSKHPVRKPRRIILFNLLHVCTSDTCKPYLPTSRQNIFISSWENNSLRIWKVMVSASFENAPVSFIAGPRFS